MVRTVGFRDIPTFRAFLRGIAGINSHDRDASKSGFVFNLCPQVVEIPRIMLSPVSLFNPCPFANTFEVFNSDPAIGAFGFLNKFLGDHVVSILRKALLFASAFLHQAFSRLSAFALQFLSEFRMAVTMAVDLITSESFSITTDCYIDNSQVNADKVIGFSQGWFGNINADKEIENTIFIYEVGLTLYSAVFEFPIIAKNKGDVNPVSQGFNIDCIATFELPESLVVGYRTVLLEAMGMLFIGLITVRYFADYAYSQLRRKAEFLAYIVIAELMQAYLTFGILRPANFRNVVTCFVKDLHCFKKLLFLLFVSLEFEFQC